MHEETSEVKGAPPVASRRGELAAVAPSRRGLSAERLRAGAELVRRAAEVRAPRIEQPHRSGDTARARRCRVLLVRVVAPPPHAQRALVEASLDHDEQLPELVRGAEHGVPSPAEGYHQGS